MATNRGSLSYTVDGGSPQTGSCYAATSVDQRACFSVRGLSYGLHTLTVTKTGGTYLTLDALNVVNSSLLQELDDTSSAITYNNVTGGGWTSQTYAGNFDGTQHYTVTNGDSVSYAFTGTGIDYISAMGTNRGALSYTVDGGSPQTGTCYATTPSNQHACFSVRGLTYGNHTITVTKTGGTYLTLDALNVYA